MRDLRSVAGALLLVLSSCAAPSHRAALPAAPAPAPPAAGGWSYEVVAGPEAAVLAVQASFAPGSGTELTVMDGAEPFVRDVEVLNGDGWTAVAPTRSRWLVPACAKGCRLRYRFLLAEAAKDNDDLMVAKLEPGGAVQAPPSTWLLRPAEAPNGVPFHFHVATAPGEVFATGVHTADGPKGSYVAETDDLYQLPYSIFGKVRLHSLEDGRLLLAIAPGSLRSEADVVEWAQTSARAVEGFYGRMPVAPLLVIVLPGRGDGIGFGTTMGHSGAAIAVEVGSTITRDELRHDWVLVHEMVHTALPDLLGPHHWLEEGLATYVEPHARVRAGLEPPEDVWAEWVRAMPNGLPQAGDRGLDRTRTWGRTYWGGALFCFLADLEIRKRTNGGKSLRDALRAVLDQSGGIASSWPITRVLEVGDKATGVPVLRELYERMANSPVDVDLGAVWKELGVAAQGQDRVTFDDGAPLAQIRRNLL